MVKLNKIYTRTGDDGTTGLVGGGRISKADPLMAAIGDVDEANSAIGVALAAIDHPGMATALRRIQNELFDLGADLATPLDESVGTLRVTLDQIERLEREIDGMNEHLAPLTSFVLPGGVAGAAQLHLARAIVRRAERSAVAAAAATALSAQALTYINRLSDWLFVAARRLNNSGASDVLWVPGASR
ncbi:MAG: cob(I)yrinic acid a,c-diamide adenosyltransferase [Sphingomonas sp.]|uniref:cob(I)yrinic acid a,c-diamide adenosyltransferase n=1 Tax=Sphingomonas sp. TaxID=28214 RepID=UPI003F7F5A7C